MRRIIIVDDDEAVLEVTALALEMHGFAVIGMQTAKDIEEYIDAFKPDSILLDYNIGDEHNGRKICEKLKSNPRTKHIKIILFTAAVIERSDFRNPLFSSFDGYLTKPYDIEDLIKIVS